MRGLWDQKDVWSHLDWPSQCASLNVEVIVAIGVKLECRLGWSWKLEWHWWNYKYRLFFYLTCTQIFGNLQFQTTRSLENVKMNEKNECIQGKGTYQSDFTSPGETHDDSSSSGPSIFHRAFVIEYYLIADCQGITKNISTENEEPKQIWTIEPPFHLLDESSPEQRWTAIRHSTPQSTSKQHKPEYCQIHEFPKLQINVLSRTTTHVRRFSNIQTFDIRTKRASRESKAQASAEAHKPRDAITATP